MDQPTLEYLAKNLSGFLSSIFVGTIFGYLNCRLGGKDKVVDKSESSKLGYATLINLGLDSIDSIETGLSGLGKDSGTNLMEVTSDDMGSIFGLYVGFHVGKLVDKGLSRLYRGRD